jgi:hypothetical protein
VPPTAAVLSPQAEPTRQVSPGQHGATSTPACVPVVARQPVVPLEAQADGSGLPVAPVYSVADRQ